MSNFPDEIPTCDLTNDLDVEGFHPTEVTLQTVVKYLRKKLACNGVVIKDKEGNDCLQFQGDHRAEISEYLVKKHGIKATDVVTHGF